MNCTIKISDIIDGIYASNALQTLAAEQPHGVVKFMLTPDHADALKRLSRDAFAWVMARLVSSGWHIADNGEDNLSASCDVDVTDNVTAAELLRTATTHIALDTIFQSSGSFNAAYRQIASDAIGQLAELTSETYILQAISTTRLTHYG